MQLDSGSHSNTYVSPSKLCMSTDCLNRLPATEEKPTALKLEEQAACAPATLCSPLPASHPSLHWLLPFLGPLSKCYGIPTHMFVYIYAWIHYSVGSTYEGQLVRFGSSHFIYFLSKSVFLFHFLYICIILHFVYLSHFHYPFVRWWTSSLGPSPCCY